MPDVVARRPARLNLTNLQTGEGFYVQFNPTQFKRGVQALYERHEVLGQSFRPLDYLGTSNATVELNLFFRAENAQERDGGQDVLNFIEALMYPPEAADSIGERRPPRVLVVWPGSLSFSAVLTDLDVTHEMFDLEGRTIQWRARTKWEEARRSRLTQEAIRDRGPMRGPEQAGGEG